MNSKKNQRKKLKMDLEGTMLQSFNDLDHNSRSDGSLSEGNASTSSEESASSESDGESSSKRFKPSNCTPPSNK